MKKFLIIASIALVVLGGFAFGLYSYVNNVRSTLIVQEKSLNSQYLANQAELSAYQASFYEQLGVANMKSDKMNKIISDAIKGRYEGDMKPGTGGAFFSAISEAYPDLSNNMDVYDKIVDFVAAKREAYKQTQVKLLDMLRAYDTYREDGLIRSSLVNAMGFPSQGLEARIGTDVKRGHAARDQMFLIVLTEDAKNAYETGIDSPLLPKPDGN